MKLWTYAYYWGWNYCFKTFRRGWWVCRVAWTIIVISYLAIPSIRTCQSDQVSYVSTLWRSHHRLGSTAQPSNPRKRVVKPPHRASRPLAQSPHRLWRPPAFCPTNCGSTSDYLGLERAVRSAKYVRILQNRRHTNSCFQTRDSYISLTFKCLLHVCLKDSSFLAIVGSPMAGFLFHVSCANGSNCMNYQHHKRQQRDKPKNQNLQMHGRPFLHPDLNASTDNIPIYTYTIISLSYIGSNGSIDVSNAFGLAVRLVLTFSYAPCFRRPFGSSKQA